MNVAFDFGITNTDVVVENKSENQFFSFPSDRVDEDFIKQIFDSINLNLKEVKNIAVTGGKSSDLDDEYMNIPITKINEVDAIGKGVKELYKTGEKPFVAISAGTGTACIYHADGKFNYLGGISIGGGTLQGLSKHLINNVNNEDIQELAITGNRNELDYLIGDIANEIGSLNSKITASNFGKAKNLDSLSSSDVAASITNMIGEVIGTVAYLNAMLCGENKVYFLGRVSLNSNIKAAIEDRLKLANITGIFEDNREYANVLGALVYLKDKIT
jgi:type II pantothenate kinase